jgi:tetratricopeptide (TPR) repeat protein
MKSFIALSIGALFVLVAVAVGAQESKSNQGAEATEAVQPSKATIAQESPAGRSLAQQRAEPDPSQEAERLLSRGVELIDQGKLDEAITYLNKALDLKADFPEAHAILCGALKEKSELKAAERELAEARRLDKKGGKK